MGFCTKCGNGLVEGARFCTKCGAPVGAAAAYQGTWNDTGNTQASSGQGTWNNTGNPQASSGQGTWNNTGNTQASSGGYRFRTCNVGKADYRNLYNVCLVTKPSQHTVFHSVCFISDIIFVIYCLVVVLPVFLPLLINGDEAEEIEYVDGMFPGFSVVVLIMIVSGIILIKTRYDIIHALPKGFDYWEIKRILQWEIFGLESAKTALFRLLRRENCYYPELGVGTDAEGNYHAVAIAGADAGRYPYCNFNRQ